MAYITHDFVHAYGVELPFLPLREEFGDLANDDVFEVKTYIEEGLINELPEEGGLFNEEKSPEFICGPGSIMFVGYHANMPFKQPILTQEQMDKKLYEAQVYLFGKEQSEKFVAPKLISEAWSE